MKILFVCTGNSCRSVMAEYVAREALKAVGRHDDEVFSAGTHAFEGSRPTEETLKALKEEGIDASAHRARHVTEEMVEQADEVFAMTEPHRDWMVKAWPLQKKKVHLFSSIDVSDPIGQSIEVYRSCLQTVKEGMIPLMKEQLDG